MCGTKTAWILREGESRPLEICPKCGQVHFRNSKPCAGALIIEDGKLLLIKRNIEPFAGYWDIPGGFLEEGEHPEDGVIRETREETGLIIKPEKILGIYMDNYCGEGSGATLNIYYISRLISGEISPGDDADDARWFKLDNLPKKIAFPDHALKVIKDLKKRY